MSTWVAWFAGVSCVAAIGCAPQARPVDLAAEQARAKAVVNRLTQVLEREDLEMLARIVPHDHDMVNFGTDATERWVGYEALEESVQRQFASFDSTRLTVRDQVVTVHPSGDVAWFSEIVDWDCIAGGEPVHLEGTRLTGVLEKRDGQWYIVQFHASVPVSGQAAQY